MANAIANAIANAMANAWLELRTRSRTTPLYTNRAAEMLFKLSRRAAKNAQGTRDEGPENPASTAHVDRSVSRAQAVIESGL